MGRQVCLTMPMLQLLPMTALPILVLHQEGKSIVRKSILEVLRFRS